MASGATASQIVWKSARGSRDIEHVGSAHSLAELEILDTAAVRQIAAGQDALPLDDPLLAGIPLAGKRTDPLLDAIASPRSKTQVRTKMSQVGKQASSPSRTRL